MTDHTVRVLLLILGVLIVVYLAKRVRENR